MTSNTPCDTECIHDFFKNGDVSVDAVLAEHLESCSSCREYFDQLAAPPEQWREAHDLLQATEFDHADSAEYSAGGQLISKADRTQSVRAVVDALAPTDNPYALGRLGSYEVTGVTGSGAMGVVLKAIDPSLDRVVAVKVMAPHLADSVLARKRFSREAKAAAAVLHPNVVPIHCVSEDEAAPYLVMAYIRGGSLQKRLERDGVLTTVEILRIGSQIAAGLSAAHEQGLVHRDIKPENILLEEGIERVTLTDFGLARAVDDASVTQHGAIAGTPQFMSPEQSRGESLDQQSDLFSLGSVLYALCTGRPPFRAESSYGVMRRICDEEPTAIRELNPEIPDWLEHIVNRLMAKHKEDRYQSAGEVHKLLEACLGHIQQPSTVQLPAEIFRLPNPNSNDSGLLQKLQTKTGIFVMLAGVSCLVLIATLIQGFMSGPDGFLSKESRQVSQRSLLDAAHQGDVSLVNKLLEEGVSIDAEDHTGRSVIQLAALGGHQDVVAILIANGASLESPVLHLAAQGGDVGVIELLIAHGVNVNANDGMGTPLKYAAWSGKVDAVKSLLEHGADVDAETDSGPTPMRYAVWGSGKHPEAAIEITQILIDAGADSNRTAEDGFTPLHESALRGSTDIAKLLIANGNDVNQQISGDGKWQNATALDIAMSYELDSFVSFIQDEGGKSGSDPTLIVVVQLKALRSALDVYKTNTGAYPTAEKGLDVLLHKPSDEDGGEKWQGPYVESLPNDPWGNAYAYEVADRDDRPAIPEIRSLGPDGKVNTDDDVTASSVYGDLGLTWESIGVTLPGPYQPDMIPLVAALNESRGRWHFESDVTDGGMQVKLKGEAWIAGGFEEAFLHESFPQWQLRLRYEWKGQAQEHVVVLMVLPDPDKMPMWLIRPQPNGRGERFDGTWDPKSRTISWLSERRNFGDEERGFSIKFGKDGRMTVQESWKLGDRAMLEYSGSLTERIDDPNFNPEDTRAAQPLPNGYEFFRASRLEIYISKDGSLELGPAVSSFETDGDLVFGTITGLPRREPDDLDTLGYFILDTKSGEVQKGLTKEQWLEELGKRGISDEPKLIDTGGNWPWGNWKDDKE